MKIQVKVLMLLTPLFVALGIALLLVQQRILLPSFAELERQAAIRDMDRVAHVLQRELDLLSVTARDWGNWADTYAFMRNHRAGYVNANLTDTAITSLRVNVLAFIAPDGHYVWATGREVRSPKRIDIDLLAGGALPERLSLRAAVSEGRKVSGLLRTNHGALLASLAPILDGQERGPSRGMVLVGRLLTDEELSRIGDQAQVQLALAPQPLTGSTGKRPPEGVLERDTVTEVTRVFPALDGTPALALRIEVPRAISQRGHQAVNYAAAFLGVAGVTVLLMMIALLNRSVLGPLARVTQHAVALGRSDDLTARLDLRRADELGVLAREFDRMLDNLAAARRQLIDNSFKSGVAENASGVLHNLGNAMTPLGIDIEALQEKLREAPTADIHLVLAELDNAGSDADRQAELGAYLRLTSRELAETVTGAQTDLDAIARNAQSIQAVLADQTARSRSELVYESILLPDLIEQSAALVPPDARHRLSIDLDATLRQLGSVRIPRTTLQQVFQNLILNAAEAVRDAGREHGTLRIEARVVDDPGGERVHLTLSDDGVGIGSDDLPRIFERGFSTKSAATNSGIGLHWSANAVAALGGKISATSPGPLGGAVIHIVLPLQPVADSRLTLAA